MPEDQFPGGAPDSFPGSPAGGTASVSLTAGTVSILYLTSTLVELQATDATGGESPYTYEWERSSDGGSTWTSISTGTLTMVDSDVTAGSAYSYRITYTDSQSSAVSVTTIITVPPGIVVITATAVRDSITHSGGRA